MLISYLAIWMSCKKNIALSSVPEKLDSPLFNFDLNMELDDLCKMVHDESLSKMSNQDHISLISQGIKSHGKQKSRREKKIIILL